MTTQEIKDLISAKVAGQGSMVDIGGALPAILNGIVEKIENPSVLTLAQTSPWADWDNTQDLIPLSTVEEEFGITPAQAEALAKGEIPFVKIYVSPDSAWRGFMFDQLVNGAATYSAGYSGVWGDISVEFEVEDGNFKFTAAHA